MREISQKQLERLLDEEKKRRLYLEQRLDEANAQIRHLVQAIPGGMVSYRVEGSRFIPISYSDGIAALFGYTRKEFDEVIRARSDSMIYELDKERVRSASKEAMEKGSVLDISYRMRHKTGRMIWVHLNGRFAEAVSGELKFYGVFTGMSSETRMFQNIVDQSADGIYVIGRENYELLYFNEYKPLFTAEKICLGQKCYTALQHKNQPCEFCFINNEKAGTQEYEMCIPETEKSYAVRYREVDWNGVPAYLIYIRDITQEVATRRGKQRLEQYFRTLIKNLPGGVTVIRCGKDGRMWAEYLSEGFAAMLGLSMEEVWEIYGKDVLRGVHPDDRMKVFMQMEECIAKKEKRGGILYRLKAGRGTYIWVKTTLSAFTDEEGEARIYADYHDCTEELQAQKRIREKYNDLIMQHYRTPGPNALIVGHCNITQGKILEIIDYTDSDLLKTFGTVREEFFKGLSQFVVEEKERQTFCGMYLEKPALESFARGEKERILTCFVKLPREARGRYVQIKMNMVNTPDSEDVTGILTVTDITEKTISERILHQLSVSGYEFVADVDLSRDHYKILTANKEVSFLPPSEGSHSGWVDYIGGSRIVPRDRELFEKGLDAENIVRRLEKQGTYTLSYSLTEKDGEIRTKNVTVAAVDLRLGRICLTRSDITESLREQQGLLNMIAYTFDQANFVQVSSKRLCMYTRESVLEKLPPYILENYEESIRSFIERYAVEEEKEWLIEQFRLNTIFQKLRQKPVGYDFVFSYRAKEGIQYKQVNVLWGDENHSTVCIVRADVTEMLKAERQAKKELEEALNLAEEANRAKSDFLSAMSHDIRTPMNAVMGMTALALAHVDDTEKVADCLKKISVSSRHLMSLINDILDMSKIERSKITLSHMKISLPELMGQLFDILEPEAKAAGLSFHFHRGRIAHEYFYGDALRMNQIFLNLIGNAIKFTPRGGTVEFFAEETETSENTAYVTYQFTIRDSGIGMSEEFLPHIFEPFTRNINAETMEGTGLGLSITKGLVDLMGGTISVESRLKEGTVFQVKLKCQVAEKGRQKADTLCGTDETQEKNLFLGRHFLVAEDNEINAEILCGILEMYGAESTVKTDGFQAVDAFFGTPLGTYDAVLMDIQMPRMNGYDAARTMRTLNRKDAKTIPIIAMTANAFAEDVQASLDAGMTAHVAKPIDIKILKTVLSRVLKEKEDK